VAQVIAALIKLAKDAAAERNRGKTFALNDELAFYDAVHEARSLAYLPSAATSAGTTDRSESPPLACAEFCRLEVRNFVG
jgi:hypothetical protein